MMAQTTGPATKLQTFEVLGQWGRNEETREVIEVRALDEASARRRATVRFDADYARGAHIVWARVKA